MKVFIGGPIKITTLKKRVKDMLDSLMQKQYQVLIGDANGVDKAVQQYLASKNYRNVEVFCVNKHRNNLGNWDTNIVEVDLKTKNKKYFTIKDKKMSEEADVGFMIWNKLSEGTLNNMVNMLVQKKNVCLFLHHENQVVILNNIDDLEKLINQANSPELTTLFTNLLIRANKTYILKKDKKDQQVDNTSQMSLNSMIK